MRSQHVPGKSTQLASSIDRIALGHVRIMDRIAVEAIKYTRLVE